MSANGLIGLGRAVVLIGGPYPGLYEIPLWNRDINPVDMQDLLRNAPSAVMKIGSELLERLMMDLICSRNRDWQLHPPRLRPHKRTKSEIT